MNKLLSRKELCDVEIFDSGIKKAAQYNDLKVHILYSGRYYFDDELREIIFPILSKYEIKSAMTTRVWMERRNIITKETMENYTKGILADANGWDRESVGDDLHTFFQLLQVGHEKDEQVRTYFLPKLTYEEMRLVEEQNENYLDSYVLGFGADVDEKEMNASESKAKFARVKCYRKTFIINQS